MRYIRQKFVSRPQPLYLPNLPDIPCISLLMIAASFSILYASNSTNMIITEVALSLFFLRPNLNTRYHPAHDIPHL